MQKSMFELQEKKFDGIHINQAAAAENYYQQHKQQLEDLIIRYLGE